MITPPYLFKGSKIGIVAPAGKIDPTFIDLAEELLNKFEFETVKAKHLENTHFQMAGTDKQRKNDLQQMLDAEDIDAIWCARGGYGTVRIIDQLDFSMFRKKPKWLIGFSDITLLHQAINLRGITSIHAPMPKNLKGKTKYSDDIAETFKLLKGKKSYFKIVGHPLNRSGHATGHLVGGNLSILYSLQGTKLAIQPKGKILFLEDLSEYLYNLDRMMHNLKLSGILKEISGLIIGQFTDMKDNEEPFGLDAYQIISEAVKEFKYPVLFNFPSGHTSTNMPMIMGGMHDMLITPDHGTFECL